MAPFILFLLIIVGAAWFLKRKKFSPAPEDLPKINHDFLWKEVLFYAKLTDSEQERFRKDVLDFLSAVRITGVDTAITDGDRLLVAAGAIIPIFYFPAWTYHNLEEVLIYSDQFNASFESAGNNDRMIMGMVGSGYLEGKMLLSKPALELGFKNQSDKNNTVIHEFVHLIDKMDGDTDGVPELLLQRQYVLPWVAMIHEQIKKIAAGKSDINPYGYTKQSEFFAVVAEYFFEQPELFQTMHPQLYEMLDKMFHPSANTPSGP